ncbi:hypothetical protein C5917_24255, partial [Escherichia coli O79:H40]|nr:hypothetical protein [Escherichia coli O79:H40]
PAHRESHTDHPVSSPLKGSVVFDVRRAWRRNKKRPAVASHEKMNKKNRPVEAVKDVFPGFA